MSDINLNLHTTSGATRANTTPQSEKATQAEKEQAVAPVDAKNVSSSEINNFMANNPATLAAMAGINFTAQANSTGAKVAQAAGATVFGDDVIAIAGNSLKLERYMARVEATPEFQKERIASSMAVLDNEI